MARRFQPAYAPLTFLICLVVFCDTVRSYRAGDDSGWSIAFWSLALAVAAWQLACAVQRRRARRIAGGGPTEAK
ncbi:hypothetical protein ACWCWD_19095 [Streptomyces sp. NPDC001493]